MWAKHRVWKKGCVGSRNQILKSTLDPIFHICSRRHRQRLWRQILSCVEISDWTHFGGQIVHFDQHVHVYICTFIKSEKLYDVGGENLSSRRDNIQLVFLLLSLVSFLDSKELPYEGRRYHDTSINSWHQLYKCRPIYKHRQHDSNIHNKKSRLLAPTSGGPWPPCTDI